MSKLSEGRFQNTPSPVAHSKNNGALSMAAVPVIQETSDVNKDALFEAPGKSYSVPAVKQFKLTPPALTGKAAITNGPVNAASRDYVAPGPLNVSSYKVAINAAVANKSEAIAAIRNEYKSIGAGLERNDEFRGTFLSGDALRITAGTNRQIALQIYEALVAAGSIPKHPKEGATIAEKQTYLNSIKPHPAMLPANLEALRGNAKIQWHDPLEIYITAPYGVKPDSIETRVDFSEGQKGYITKVSDTANEVNATLADRPNLLGHFPAGRDNDLFKATGKTIGKAKAVSILVGAEKGKSLTYSNIHHVDDSQTMGDQISKIKNDAKRSTNEAGIDAYTKLIAEGGRWDCVGNLGLDLVDDSLFFTSSGDGYLAVDFRTLWGKWTEFGCSYGISDEAMVDKLNGKENVPPEWVRRLSSKPKGKHAYDLDTGGRGTPIPRMRGALMHLNQSSKEDETLSILSALHRNMGW